MVERDAAAGAAPMSGPPMVGMTFPSLNRHINFWDFFGPERRRLRESQRQEAVTAHTQDPPARFGQSGYPFTPIPPTGAAEAREIAFAGLRDLTDRMISGKEVTKLSPFDSDVFEQLSARDDALFAAYGIDPFSKDADRQLWTALAREFLPVFQMREAANTENRRPNTDRDEMLLHYAECIREATRGPEGEYTLFYPEAQEKALNWCVERGFIDLEKDLPADGDLRRRLDRRKRTMADRVEDFLESFTTIANRKRKAKREGKYARSPIVVNYLTSIDFRSVSLAAAKWVTDPERHAMLRLRKSISSRDRDTATRFSQRKQDARRENRATRRLTIEILRAKSDTLTLD